MEPAHQPSPSPDQDAYRIHWRNRANGRKGVGPKEFPRAEALELAEQLNYEYPDIEHVAVCVNDIQPKIGVLPAPASQPVRNFKPMSDLDLFPNFGPHARKVMRSVPADYLDYLRGQPQLMRAWPELADYIERNKKAINQDLDRLER